MERFNLISAEHPGKRLGGWNNVPFLCFFLGPLVPLGGVVGRQGSMLLWLYLDHTPSLIFRTRYEGNKFALYLGVAAATLVGFLPVLRRDHGNTGHYQPSYPS
jgi:hypothetical protein